MRNHLGTALAAAAVLGLGACAHESASARSAGSDTGRTTSGSIEGTQGTAGGASSGTAITQGQSGTQSGTDPSSGSMQNPSATSTGPSAASGAPVAGSPNTPSSPTYGPTTNTGNGSNTGSGTYGQAAFSDSGNPETAAAINRDSTSSSGSREVVGRVAKVDQNQGSVTLDQASGGVTLTVDSETKVLKNGVSMTGISALREGVQVRASFDPASNRADKIEIMGGKAKKQKSAMGRSPNQQEGTPDGTHR